MSLKRNKDSKKELRLLTLSSTWEGEGVEKIKDWVSKGNHCRSGPPIDTFSKIRHFDL